MPAAPSPAQTEASRRNGARSSGPATAAGKARSARTASAMACAGGPSSCWRTRTRPSSRSTRRCGSPLGARATCTSRRRRPPRSVACGARSVPTGWRWSCWTICSPPTGSPTRASGRRQGHGLQGPEHAAALPRPHRARAPPRDGSSGDPAPAPPRTPDRANPRRRERVAVDPDYCHQDHGRRSRATGRTRARERVGPGRQCRAERTRAPHPEPPSAPDIGRDRAQGAALGRLTSSNAERRYFRPHRPSSLLAIPGCEADHAHGFTWTAACRPWSRSQGAGARSIWRRPGWCPRTRCGWSPG